MVTDKKVVVRFAPSPTGGLHVGGIRTALFNYIFAKKHGGAFLLRIEDTDTKRFDKSAEAHIAESLKWLGIIPDMSPLKDLTPLTCSDKLRQSDRFKAGVYAEPIKQLIASGAAYMAFDTTDELTAARAKWKEIKHMAGYNHAVRMSMRNSLSLPADEVESLLSAGTPYVVRFKTVPGENVEINDVIRGKVVINTNEMDDKVLVKNDGMPTYHLANILDDHDMEVTHVIRGEEWLPSTPLHVLLYRAFGWDVPVFAHLPLILNEDGSKMSKRTAMKLGISVFAVKYEGTDEEGADATMDGFRELGFEADALVNFLALMGWHPTHDREIMPLDMIIEDFTLERCGSSGAIFDVAKLKAFNFDYVRRLDPGLLVPTEAFTGMSVDNYMQIVEWTRERSHKRADAITTYGPFAHAPSKYDVTKKNPWTDVANAAWSKAVELFESDPDLDKKWTYDYIESTILAACAATGVEKKNIMAALRMALTGGLPGPDLIGTMVILGPNESISRLERAAETLYGTQEEN